MRENEGESEVCTRLITDSLAISGHSGHEEEKYVRDCEKFMDSILGDGSLCWI